MTVLRTFQVVLTRSAMQEKQNAKILKATKHRSNNIQPFWELNTTLIKNSCPLLSVVSTAGKVSKV